MTELNKEDSKDLLAYLKENSLKSAGLLYLLGDGALVGAGLLKGKGKEAFTGAAWAVGGLTAARYGNPTAEKQLHNLTVKLGDYLRKQGVEIPKGGDATTAALAKPGGVLDHVEQFLYQYPSQILNAVYATSSIPMFQSGWKEWRHEGRNAGLGVAASAVLVMAGGLAGLLIPEKPAANLVANGEDAKNKGFLGRIADWVQERPNRVPGVCYVLGNVMQAYTAWDDRSTHRLSALSRS